MPLKISKIINLRSEKIGRNDPCPCGSGKKYKKCCLNKEETYSPLIHKSRVSRMVDWVMSQSFFKNLLEKKIKEIFQNNITEENELYGLIEALIFEEKINGQTALECFIKEAPLSDEERQMYQSWQKKSFFSIFEVVDVNIGKSVRLKNLVDGKIYLVFEKMGTYQIEKGMIVPARLIPLENFWMMGGGLNTVIPENEELSYALKRNLKINPYPISEMEFIKIFYGKELEEKDEIKIKNFSHNEAKEQLTKLLKEKNVSYQISDLEEMILGKKEFNQDKIIEELSLSASSERELENWIALLSQYWQTHPKFQNDTLAPGPKEKFLINQLLFELQNQNLDKYPKSKVNKIITEFSQKWFETPQEELNGKTPRMVIIEEREARGNPNKELTYQFSFNRFDFRTAKEKFVEKYNLATRLMAKEHQFLKALEMFSEISLNIDFLENEKFRWYGKVATCLLNLGEIELGKKYLQKSLELNPSYKISQKNLAIVNNSEKIRILKEFGSQRLFISILEKQLVFEIPEIERCELLKDVLFFLNYLDQNKISLSEKQRNIQSKDILSINKNLIHPNPEAIQIGSYIAKYRSEWQFPKVNFLRTILESAKFCEDDGKNLILTSLGKKFLNENPEKQFSQIFTAWFLKVDWKNFDKQGGLLKPSAEILQNQSWRILKTLKEFGLKRKFSSEEILTNVFYLFENRKSDKLGKTLMLLFLERVLDHLAWANIIADDKQNKKKDILDLPLYDTLYLTNFGFNFISSIEEEMQNAIPKILKNEI